MNTERFRSVTGLYRDLRIAVVGDFCLDRYYEIDPARTETSLETGLPVRNVVRIRAQPGAAGTVLNNLAALGIGTIFPVGFCGDDGEGYELRRALSSLSGVRLDHFVTSPARATFTYGKPLVVAPGQPPRELERLDTKNWIPTPPDLAVQLADSVRALCKQVDAIAVMDQVDVDETGVACSPVLQALAACPVSLPIVADSRRGLGQFPSAIFKMNARELAKMNGLRAEPDVETARAEAAKLAARLGRRVFVTLAERGIVGAEATGVTAHRPALPVRGPIDIVGAGDSVTASLTAALAAGASLEEAMELAMAAASIVVHQLGTTGTATVAQLKTLVLRA